MSKMASHPPHENTTTRHKWTFSEVARHIKSHGLKGSLRSAGRTASPLLQRLERGFSKTGDPKAPPSPSLETKTRPSHAPASQLTGVMGLKERPIVMDDNTLREAVPKRTVPPYPVESSLFLAGCTGSVGDPMMERLEPQCYNVDVNNTTGTGARNTKSFMGSPRGPHENNGSVESGVFGDYKCQTDAPNQLIPKEITSQPNEFRQGRESIMLSSESAGKQGADRKFSIHHIGREPKLEDNTQVKLLMVENEAPSKIAPTTSETDPIGDTLISRQMTAAEVVSHLVRHGIADMSETLNYSTFDEHPIVTGGSSDIYRGQLKGGAGVAVKVLRFVVQSFSDASENIRDAARELHTWSKCSHPNVLPLYGLVTFRNRIGMVSPWMSEGTMPHYLEANPKANRQNLCIQICEGLSYLHKNGVVHGDLKGANVLVSQNGIPVLTDFGNSTLKDRTLKFTQGGSDSAFTVRWSAPEFIKDSGPSLRTKASDVYALGMTIYEAIVGKVPYYGETELQVIIMVAMKKIPPKRPDWVRSGHESEDRLWDLLTHCWSWEPEARPSVTEVASTLNQIYLDTP